MREQVPALLRQAYSSGHSLETGYSAQSAVTSRLDMMNLAISARN